MGSLGQCRGRQLLARPAPRRRGARARLLYNYLPAGLSPAGALTGWLCEDRVWHPCVVVSSAGPRAPWSERRAALGHGCSLPSSTRVPWNRAEWGHGTVLRVGSAGSRDVSAAPHDVLSGLQCRGHSWTRLDTRTDTHRLRLIHTDTHRQTRAQTQDRKSVV